MNETGLTVRAEGQAVEVHQAVGDDKVIGMWLHGRPLTTVRAYNYEVRGLMRVIGKNLRTIALVDLQGYVDTLQGLAPASQARAIIPASA